MGLLPIPSRMGTMLKFLSTSVFVNFVNFWNCCQNIPHQSPLVGAQFRTRVPTEQLGSANGFYVEIKLVGISLLRAPPPTQTRTQCQRSQDDKISNTLTPCFDERQNTSKSCHIMFGGVSAETISRQRRVVEAREIGLWCKFENLSCQRLSSTRWGLDFHLLDSPVIIREERRGLLRPCPREATAPQGRHPLPPHWGPLLHSLIPALRLLDVLWSLGRKLFACPISGMFYNPIVRHPHPHVTTN